jgi:hypothetical protein
VASCRSEHTPPPLIQIRATATSRVHLMIWASRNPVPRRPEHTTLLAHTHELNTRRAVLRRRPRSAPDPISGATRPSTPNSARACRDRLARAPRTDCERPPSSHGPHARYELPPVRSEGSSSPPLAARARCPLARHSGRPIDSSRCSGLAAKSVAARPVSQDLPVRAPAKFLIGAGAFSAADSIAAALVEIRAGWPRMSAERCQVRQAQLISRSVHRSTGRRGMHSLARIHVVRRADLAFARPAIWRLNLRGACSCGWERARNQLHLSRLAGRSRSVAAIRLCERACVRDICVMWAPPNRKRALVPSAPITRRQERDARLHWQGVCRPVRVCVSARSGQPTATTSL